MQYTYIYIYLYGNICNLAWPGLAAGSPPPPLYQAWALPAGRIPEANRKLSGRTPALYVIICNICDKICNICNNMCNICNLCNNICNICGNICNIYNNRCNHICNICNNISIYVVTYVIYVIIDEIIYVIYGIDFPLYYCIFSNVIVYFVQIRNNNLLIFICITACCFNIIVYVV